MPTISQGTGDGVGYGEECFVWQDLPMQNGMSPTVEQDLSYL
jgi:hypothetical protein